MADPYDSGVHEWWHLSSPSPELLGALGDGWLSGSGRVLDLGCGLGSEIAHLAAMGVAAFGVDLSLLALKRAGELNTGLRLVRADVLRLPFSDGSFDALLDRGCFHYLSAVDRPAYAREAARVLGPGGRLLLRACLKAAGVRNDIDVEVLRRTFAQWRFRDVFQATVPSDTRPMAALVARLKLSAPGPLTRLP